MAKQLMTTWRDHKARLSTWILLACLCGWIGDSGHATILYVSPQGNEVAPYASWADASTRIQDAIDYAVSGDTVLVFSGSYTGDGNRDLTFHGENVVLMSLFGSDFTTIDCQGTFDSVHRAFVIVEGEDSTCTIKGFTITNGYLPPSAFPPGGGAVLLDGSSPTFEDVTFVSNNGGSFGGAIFCESESAPHFIRCRFDRNVVQHAGGAVYSTLGSSPTFEACVFERNNGGHRAGAMWAHDSELKFSKCSFYDNGPVGACFIQFSTATFVTCSFSDNYAEDAPAVFSSESNVNFDRCILSFNLSDTGAAVLSVNNSTLNVTCCDVFGNSNGDWIGSLALFKNVQNNFSLDPMYCQEDVSLLNLTTGSPCAPAFSPCGLLVGARDVDCQVTAVSDDPPLLPLHIQLGQNYPNPFNNRTIIQFTLARNSHCKLQVFDIRGARVATLVDAELPAGTHEQVWSGNSDSGSQVSSGVYFYSLKAEGRELAKRMLLLK